MKKQILSIVLIIVLMILFIPFGVVNAEDIPVADVTVYTWSDLQNEITNATSSKVIKLGSDIVAPDPTNNSSISVAAGKDITIDLNGCVLDRGLISNDETSTPHAHGSVIEVAGTLTIVDGNPNVEHKGTLSGSGYFWNWDDGANTGDFIIKGGILTGGCRTGSYNGGSGVRVDNANAKFNMKGGTITGNNSLNKAHAGGVYVNTGVFNMTGGEIKYNTAVQHGGGVFIRYGTFNMSGTAKITNNSVSSNGGGVYLMNNPTASFTMNGGEISYNKAKDGGGVRVESSMAMNGGTIKNNIATGEGGGVRGSVIMTDGEISYNTAASNGGGIRGVSTISGGLITGNTSKGSGGGYNGNITMTGGVITDNTSVGNGGGIYVDTTITLGGDAIVSGNHKGETVDNVFLGADKTITISSDKLPTSDMNIGVTTAVAPVIGTPVAITSNGNTGDENYFDSDNNNYYVLNQSNILKLVKDGNPTGKILFKEKSFTSFLNSITFGLYFNNKFDVEITASDDIEVKSIEYYISNKQMTEEEVKAITTWKTYSKFAIDSDSKYVIYAKITDSIDNVTYISSDGFVLDTVIPVINGLDASKTYYTSQKFTVTEENLKQVLIDDAEVNDYKLVGNINKTYHIKVIDKADNKIENFEVTMKTIESLSDSIKDLTIENVKLNDKTIIENTKNTVKNVDVTNATDTEKEEIQEIIDECDLLLEAIKNKYISKVDLTLTIPKAGQTVEDNIFAVTSKYDNIVISVKEWKLNGGSDVLPNDYVFEEGKLYIPILKIEVKNQTNYFDENTTLTVHGSEWSNKEGTYSLKEHREYGYVKDLSNGSFLIDEMTIKINSKPKYEVILGANQTYVINKNEEAMFEINAEYSLFEGKIYIDDILLDPNDYTSEAGSTIIRLKKAFVDSLKLGKHTLRAEFSDGGEASTNFTIDILNDDNPKTVDNIVSYLIIGIISLISLASCYFYINRKRFN